MGEKGRVGSFKVTGVRKWEPEEQQVVSRSRNVELKVS